MNGKPHPHAELIKQMLDDDSLRATQGNETFERTLESVVMYPSNPWRLVPPKPKTITIVANGKTYVLPEPMRVAPEVGTKYFAIDNNEVMELDEWCNDRCDIAWLKDTRCHATREAAQAWADAMAEIRGAK